jgi:hypothetical protein
MGNYGDKEEFFSIVNGIGHEIYKMLEKEYEYQMSDEYIEESIRMNDYEFTNTGNRF